MLIETSIIIAMLQSIATIAQISRVKIQKP